MRHQRRDVGYFSLFGPQELLSRWNVEEEIPNGDGGATRVGEFLDAKHFSAGDFDHRADAFLARLGFEQQPRHRRDGW